MRGLYVRRYLHKFTTLFTNITTSHAKLFGWKVSIYNHFLPELNSIILLLFLYD